MHWQIICGIMFLKTLYLYLVEEFSSLFFGASFFELTSLVSIIMNIKLIVWSVFLTGALVIYSMPVMRS
jgi:hypothetical protein